MSGYEVLVEVVPRTRHRNHPEGDRPGGTYREGSSQGRSAIGVALGIAPGTPVGGHVVGVMAL